MEAKLKLATHFTEKMKLIESISKLRLRDRQFDDRGVAIVEFALVMPVLLLMTFGVIEIGMIMAVQSTLEGGLKEASRYGILGQSPADSTRAEKIRAVLNTHALGLVDMSEATFTVNTYPNFAGVGQPEPYSDLDGNGQFNEWDMNGDGSVASGEGDSYTDVNQNGHWDADQGSSGAGMGGEIAAYTVTVPWHIMTPFAGDLMSANGTIPLQATIVVRNEPNLYNN